ncbi:hypothetical protein CKY10_01430 [Photorhabdus sp. HUG-39]|uniref:Phage protein n=1 Tax=Photorhabdus kayaii TaxID=230088 RepID=A0ABX0AWL4_9GAMM|nr:MULTISPECIES: hypothetical protein [Photorhabdus]MCC8375890.1 hypothetical protein [Photorhabdus bodei]NDL10206.1 hypothetical protein [Photorhabdus kayaii]NDL23920.1 hypothetical protein [Photorhabdus kayaii]RAX12515.1 hypothetical protein CKY10_01430 [Photorhabdus sp. HUG-39]
MNELTNLHTAPLTVTDENGKRITIPVGHSVLVLVNGDFIDHLFHQAGMMRVEVLDTPDADTDDKDIGALREEYETLMGKKAPSAAKAAALQKAIAEKRKEIEQASRPENTDNPSI